MRISDWSSDVCSSDLPTAPPAPPPPPQPKREAVGAKPRSNPGSWATNADYPSSALRNEEEGTTGFRVTVGTNGRVTDCSVTSSSGSSTLDAATCRLINRRARFTPAEASTAHHNTDPSSHLKIRRTTGRDRVRQQ